MTIKILFLSRWFPYPPDNGSKIRIFHLIKALAVRHSVGLISFASEPVTNEQLSALRPYCPHIGIIPYKPFQPRRLRALLGFFSPRPRSVVDTYSAEMKTLVTRLVREYSFDVVIASQMDMAPYALGLSHGSRIFEEVELTTIYERYALATGIGQKLSSGLTWWKSARYTAGLLRSFDGCTVVSEAERERVVQVAPGCGPIGVVPNGVDVADYEAQSVTPEADTLIYSGSLTYLANFDAMDFFLREIYPLILAERPGVKLLITGRLDGVPIERLPRHPDVIFTGYLDDVRLAIARSWASVVPLRIGGGTRLKILEAMALGTPVIATRKGAEGLDVVPGRDLLIADDPSEFAGAVLQLLCDPARRQVLSQNGRRVVAARYDWSEIGQRFISFVETVVRRRQARPVLMKG